MTRPLDTWDNQFFRSGGHCRTILTDSEEENGEAGCNESKRPHGHWPTHGHEPSSALPIHTKNESARNAAKCGPAQTERESRETAGFLSRSAHFLQR